MVICKFPMLFIMKSLSPNHHPPACMQPAEGKDQKLMISLVLPNQGEQTDSVSHAHLYYNLHNSH